MSTKRLLFIATIAAVSFAVSMLIAVASPGWLFALFGGLMAILGVKLLADQEWAVAITCFLSMIASVALALDGPGWVVACTIALFALLELGRSSYELGYKRGLGVASRG